MKNMLDYGEFVLKTQAEKRSYLRHPAWSNRCLCSEYGFPWPQMKEIMAEGGTTHTRTVCAPTREFFA